MGKPGIHIEKIIQCLLFFELLFISSSAVAQTAIDTQRIIRVVMDNNYAPYAFHSDEGKLQGILVDQWTAWEKQTGIKADIHAMDWSEALQRIRAGEFDVIDCIVETADRQDYFDFTPAYKTVEASVYFRNGISGISDITSVGGFAIGVKTGDQHIDKLKAGGVKNLILFDNNESIIEAAKKHTINVFVMDDPSALYLLNKLGIESEFRHTVPIFRDELRRAVRKGDTATLNIVSNGFAAIKSSRLKQIDEKWFGLTINKHERYLRYLKYAIYAMAIAALLIAGLAIWNRTLRKKILQRTAALRQSEDHIRLIIDTIPTMAWSAQPDGTVDFVNQRWLDYTGEKGIEQPNRVVHPEDLPGVVERWFAKKADGKLIDDEMRLRGADGKYRWFLVRTAPLHDEHGNLIKWYGVTIDIEDSKRAEDELRLAYQRLSYHVENTPLSVIEWDKDLNITKWSGQAEKIFGWKASEVLGRNRYDRDFPIVYKEDEEKVAKVDHELMNGLVDRNLSLNRNYTKDGKVIYCEWYNSVLRDEHGNVITILSLVQDVTERKMAEEALLKSEDHLRLVTDTIPALVVSSLPDGSVDFINQTYQQFTGLSLNDVAGWRWTSAIHPDDRKKIIDEWRYSLATGVPMKIETRLRRASGEYCWLLVYAVPLRDESGNIVRWYGTKTDITELKQAEDALRRSEDRIRFIIDTIPIIAWSISPDGTPDFVNRQWKDYTGISEEEQMKNPNQPIHPEDLPHVVKNWEKNLAAGKRVEDEMRVRRADGIYRWFLARTDPLHDDKGNIIKWYGVAIDIDDSKRAEAALRESEQRYLSLFENMAEGVAYFQMLFKEGKLQDAIYLQVNPAWEKLTGLQNVIGRKLSEILPGILEVRTEFMERSARVALTGQPERFEAYSVFLKKWLSTSAYCPKKEHVIVVIDDITERKTAEETLQRSYEEIRQLTEHLQKIREEERTSIAREIHDELGQQLTAIKMDVAWIDKKTPEETTDIKRKLKNIIELLDGGNLSIRRILSELRPQILDDHGLLEAIEWLGRQLTETTSIAVKYTTPEKDIKVSEQIATCIFRVCQEAFTNITRYALAKNVSISISIIEKNIILTIEDDGIGFDPASIQNKKSFGILGMKERVFSLGGKFELVSSPGKGTRIVVSLPYSTELN